MANIVKYNTRLIQKHDTEANWELVPDFIPLAGELIIYDPDSICTHYRVKYGDGITNVVDLPFASEQTDYEQNDENHIGYMQNRPFYDDRIEETFTATFDGDKSDDTVVTSYGSDYVWVSENTIEDLSIIDRASVNVIINGVENTIDISNSMWQDVSSMLVGVPAQGAFGAVYDEDDKISLVVFLQQNIGQYPKGIYVLANDDLCVTSFTYITKQGELKQIDSKFIPPLPRTYIRYSAYADGTDFTEEWSTGQNYIGYAEAVEAPTDKADYQWSLFASNIRDTLSITLAADAWINKQQTIITAMIGDDSTVFASPNPSSNDAYAEAGVILSGATSQSLTFACEVVPAVDIDVEVYVSNPLVIAGVQADYEQNDSTQADYIKNRPFGDESVSLGDTLTWDGTPTDTSIWIADISLERVSDNTPSVDELVGGSFVMSIIFNSTDGETNVNDRAEVELTSDNVLQANENFIVLLNAGQPNVGIALEDGAIFEVEEVKITFPKKGIYFIRSEDDQWDGIEGYSLVYISSLTAPNYNFTKTEIKKLDPKFLPEGGVGYEETHTEEIIIEYDGDLTGKTVVDVSGDGATTELVVKISDLTPEPSELIGGTATLNGNSYTITADVIEDYRIDGLSYALVGGNIVIVYSPTLINEFTYPEAGIYIIHLGVPESLKYTGTVTNIHKINPKYLPEGVGYEGVTDIGDTLTWDGTPTDTVVEALGMRTYRVSDSTPNIDELIGSRMVYSTGDTGELTSDALNKVSETVIIMFAAYMFVASVDNASCVVDDETIVFPQKGIYFTDSVEDGNHVYISQLTIPNYNFTKTEVHKIDKKFLPDDIGGGEDEVVTVLYDGAPTKMDLTSAGLGYAYLLSSDDLFSSAYGQDVYYEYTLANGTKEHGVLKRYYYLSSLSLPALGDAFTLIYNPTLGGTGVSFDYADIGEISNIKLWTVYSKNKPYFLRAVQTGDTYMTLPYDVGKAEYALMNGLLMVYWGGYIPRSPVHVDMALHDGGIRRFNVFMIKPNHDTAKTRLEFYYTDFYSNGRSDVVAYSIVLAENS